MIFTCSNCEGNMVYSPEKKKMFCPYCEAEGSQQMRHVNQGKLTKFCPNCGGEIPLGEHDSALQCPYCDNYIIQDERIEEKYKPDYVLPFQMGKEAMKQMFKEHFKKYRFAPTDFLTETRLNTIKGYYVPFWFYDYNTRCIYRGEGTKTRTWTSGDTRYTETSYFDVQRDLEIEYDKIPADASIKMPDDVMDLMEPYDYKQMIPFDAEYLSGFFGEKYNMEATVTAPRAKDKMESSAKAVLRESCADYLELNTAQETINVQGSKTSYGLLPVWKYDYEYQGKQYPFYVNGQTGKIVGSVPVSKKKVYAYSATIGACIAVILGALNLIAML